jgi:hypothetical protein
MFPPFSAALITKPTHECHITHECMYTCMNSAAITNEISLFYEYMEIFLFYNSNLCIESGCHI